MVLGPTLSLFVTTVSVVVSHLLRRSSGSTRRLFTVLASRAAALLAAVVVWSYLAPRVPVLVDFMAVPAAYLVVELAAAQAVTALWTGRPLARLLRGNITSQAPLIAAQWSASVLLLLTYGGMAMWSLIPALALLLLMRQSYALFLDIRETYRMTVEVLVEAAESQDERRVGHADRTAAVARSIAMRIGLPAAEVERISFAALLHDLGELADESTSDSSPKTSSAAVVSEVEFFSRVEPILSVCDGAGADANHQDDLLAALIVALSSDIDAERNPQVAAAHAGSAIECVLPHLTSALKARVVGAALQLGYRVPAVG
jgi:hypothetical protein